MEFTRISGEEDPQSPQVVELSGKELMVGNFINQQLGKPEVNYNQVRDKY